MYIVDALRRHGRRRHGPRRHDRKGTSAEGVVLEGTAAESDSGVCPVCSEVLDAATAVLLDCTHVFCTTCHEKLSRLPSSRQTRAGAVIECSLCRKRAELTEIVRKAEPTPSVTLVTSSVPSAKAPALL